jgi:hypothetical protein
MDTKALLTCLEGLFLFLYMLTPTSRLHQQFTSYPSCLPLCVAWITPLDKHICYCPWPKQKFSMGKPELSNKAFPETAKYEKKGLHLKLYSFSPDDYKQAGLVFNGPHRKMDSPWSSCKAVRKALPRRIWMKSHN